MRVWALVVAAAMLLSTSPTPSSALSAGVWINIVDAPRPQPKWGYAPGTSTIAPGTWVTWSNAGQDAHTVTAVDGSFDSGELDPSEGFSWFFSQPGAYAYVCSLHPWMTGAIVVSGDASTAQVTPTGASDGSTASSSSAGSDQPSASGG